MATCKYNHDDICVNADCPYVADYCPVFEDDSICRFNVAEVERCVVCGDPIPERRQVCPRCEKEVDND